jgi:lysozyme
MRELNQAGLDLIKSFEGIEDGDPSTVNLDAYLDPVRIWTIGWGHAIVYGVHFLHGLGNKELARSLYPEGITKPQAEDLLRQDVAETVREVEHLVKDPLTDNQFAALVSFTFNLGPGNLTKLLRKGLANVADRFLLFNQAGGKPLKGLTRRRQAERELWLRA